MKLLVINNLKSGYGEGAVYDFIRSFVSDGDEVCMRSTDGSTEVATMLYDAAIMRDAKPPRRVGGQEA